MGQPGMPGFGGMPGGVMPGLGGFGGLPGGVMPGLGGFGGFPGGVMPGLGGFGGFPGGFGAGVGLLPRFGLPFADIPLGFNIAPLNRVFGGPFQGPFAAVNGGTWAGPMRNIAPIGGFGLPLLG